MRSHGVGSHVYIRPRPHRSWWDSIESKRAGARSRAPSIATCAVEGPRALCLHRLYSVRGAYTTPLPRNLTAPQAARHGESHPRTRVPHSRGGLPAAPPPRSLHGPWVRHPRELAARISLARPHRLHGPWVRLPRIIGCAPQHPYGAAAQIARSLGPAPLNNWLRVSAPVWRRRTACTVLGSGSLE